MPYDYYYQLSKSQQALYDKSDAISQIKFQDIKTLKQYVLELQKVLPEGVRAPVRNLCQNITNEICRQLKLPKIKVLVEDKRPVDEVYELYGYYEPGQLDEDTHTLTVWMRTPKRNQVVAFKTFLRTLLHEICHHIDYYYFQWDESFHTEGFYKRESSLFYQFYA